MREKSETIYKELLMLISYSAVCQVTERQYQHFVFYW